MDKKILRQLLKNCLAPMSDMAADIGITRQTVAKKIELYKKSGLIRLFTIKLDPEKLGLKIRAFVLIREDPESENKKINENIIKEIPQVTSYYTLFGRYDAVAEVLAKDKTELTNLVKQIRQLKGIKDTETFIIQYIVKDELEDSLYKALEN
ncbi:MAG: Lrp/AsnC family transcriptional regulator [Candidatus Bathyarchaeota archaeon]|nr:Lrp/AsnC family transcriptional regulator [Candidatus Bathyarchaeota archaeon]